MLNQAPPIGFSVSHREIGHIAPSKYFQKIFLFVIEFCNFVA